MVIRVAYFALLREQAGISEEVRETNAHTCGELYEELRRAYGFTLPSDLIRPARNGAFADPDEPLSDGDLVVFIPPVAGG